MYWKTFVCLCRQTMSRIYIFFNTVHSMSDMNNIYQFQNIWRIFTRVRAPTDRKTDGQTDRQTECINTFHPCWKVLKSITHLFMISRKTYYLYAHFCYYVPLNIFYFLSLYFLCRLYMGNEKRVGVSINRLVSFTCFSVIKKEKTKKKKLFKWNLKWFFKIKFLV